ncbi:MFS transporter [Sporomusa sp.]|uniref:MFS transporter n=1 Tax=Sporomusa sp. TaxID=2078658 RepID=UPI002CD91E8F|nr:MFS transporter [Sporomusa sp.]HWR05327.1 MFS transporter [Sporomusa sp.]
MEEVIQLFNSFKSVPKSIWLLAIAHGVVDMSPGAFYAALPFLKIKFSLSYAELGSIVLMQSITSSISQPFFGYLCDRKARVWFMPVGCLILGISMLGTLLSPIYSLVFLSVACNGIGSAIFHPQAAKTVNLLSGSAKGKSLSLFSVGGNVGIVAGSLFLASLLIHGEGPLLLIYPVPYLLISGALFYFLHKVPRLETTACTSFRRLKASVNWSLLALMGTVLTRATVSSGISTFVPLYYMTYLHGSELYASFLLTVHLGAGAVGTVIGGALSDRWGSKQIMLYSILPIAAALSLFKILDGPWIFAVLAIASILLAATATSSLVFIQKMMPNNLGMASGLNLGFSSGLGALGILAMGRVADVWGMPLAFDLLATLPVIGFIMTLFVQEPVEKRVELEV